MRTVKVKKKRMLANEGLRRLLNMSPDLPWQDSVQVMNQFSFKMSRQGNLNEEQTGLQSQEGARGRRGRGNMSRGARSRGGRSRGSGN